MTRSMKSKSSVRRRTNAFLGQGVALTYLTDQSPIFVDPRDSGVAAAVRNGGLYEPDDGPTCHNELCSPEYGISRSRRKRRRLLGGRLGCQLGPGGKFLTPSNRKPI